MTDRQANRQIDRSVTVKHTDKQTKGLKNYSQGLKNDFQMLKLKGAVNTEIVKLICNTVARQVSQSIASCNRVRCVKLPCDSFCVVVS